MFGIPSTECGDQAVLVWLLIAATLSSCDPTGEASSTRVSRSATPPSNTPKPSAASAECRRRIAFVGRTDGEKDIFVINADGSGLINVTNAAGNEKHASWSPDGTCLAFVSYHGGRSALYVMNANGGGLTKLADNADWGSQPSWSP